MSDDRLKSDFLGMNLVGFFGVVEDREDPLKLGRVRVRCYGWHTDNLEDVPTDSLPWAHTLQPSNSASNSGIGLPATGLIEGSLVFGFFLDGDKAQRPMVVGSLPGIPQEGPNTSYGFNDPDGRYPSIPGEPDTSRLARNESITGTIIASKHDKAVSGIRVANNRVVTWDQPESLYNARYPYNQVWATESGHVIELDDSEGSERVHIYHRSGTNIEIDANGTKVTQTVGDDYEVADRSKYVYIKGIYNVTVDGDCNMRVANNYNLDVDGNWNVKVKNDFNMEVSGTSSINTNENLNIKSDNMVVSTDTDLDFTVAGESNFAIGKNYMLNAAKAYINSSGNNEADPQSNGLANTAIRATLNPQPIPFLARQTRDDLLASFFDDLEANDDALTPEVESVIQSETITNSEGRNTDQTVTTSPVNPSSSSVTSNERDSSFANQKRFADTFKLSDNYNLSKLSSRAVVSKYRVRPQHGLTTAEIVQNLKGVAENVLEPILKQYPDMIVTSGFRTGNSRSQHERGKAVDIQFRNRSKEDYYEIAQWIASNVPYDQLLLEYKNTGTKLPWIHISHDFDKNRGQQLTFFNHRKKANGLVQLA